MVHGNVVEEVADEILEEVDCSESFHDAKSLFEAASDISDQSTVNSLLMERKSNFGEGLSLVHIDNDDKVDGNDEDDDVDHTDYGHQLDMRGNLKGNWILPIYDGEVILPHPGKMHVSAWMYPIQMISIPSTEVAFEKGWEPGGNKYTLYSINVSTCNLYQQEAGNFFAQNKEPTKTSYLQHYFQTTIKMIAHGAIS